MTVHTRTVAGVRDADAAASDAAAAWADVVQVALLGTASAGHAAAARALGDASGSALGDATDPLGALLAARAADGAAADGAAADGAAPGDGAAARRLLDRAAVLSTYLRAGRLPARAPAPAAAPAPEDRDDLPVCPAAAAQRLATMLLGEHREALPEWLARAGAAGWRVPPLLLPAALDLARAAPALRDALGHALGARGRWLAARNPAWTFALAHGGTDAARAAWDAGTPAEREAALRRLRRGDPSGARALLAAAWPRESAPTRARLLGALAEALGPDDEALLEEALDDRSREVRAAAAGLLAALPASALVRRMAERARALLRYEPGGFLRRARLDVALPGPPDSAAERDGVVRAVPNGVGERAWWLAQLVAAVPPAVWPAALGADAERLVELAGAGEWGPALADGWARAAARHGDARWAEALLRAGALSDRRKRLAPPRAELLALLPHDRRERLALDVLAGRVALDEVEGLLADLPAPWDVRLARAALAWLRERATRSDAHLTAALSAFALAAPPALADEAAAGWPSDLPPHRARAVEQLAATLAFRRALDAAFPAPP